MCPSQQEKEGGPRWVTHDLRVRVSTNHRRQAVDPIRGPTHEPPGTFYRTGYKTSKSPEPLRFIWGWWEVTLPSHKANISVPKVLGLFIYSREGDFSLREPLVKITDWAPVFLMFLKWFLSVGQRNTWHRAGVIKEREDVSSTSAPNKPSLVVMVSFTRFPAGWMHVVYLLCVLLHPKTREQHKKTLHLLPGPKGGPRLPEFAVLQQPNILLVWWASPQQQTKSSRNKTKLTYLSWGILLPVSLTWTEEGVLKEKGFHINQQRSIYNIQIQNICWTFRCNCLCMFTVSSQK